MMELMDEMADQIRNALSVAAYEVQVEPRLVLNPTPPCIDIYPGDIGRDEPSAAFDDLSGAYLFTLRARVSTADHTAGQDLLLAFMDDANQLSLARALDDDPTLNGYATSLDVRGQTGYIVYPDAGGEGVLLGCQWQVMVLAAQS
jgi:hypothetical protein